MRKILFRLSIAFAVFFILSIFAHADTITLQGTIRDFKSSHPDFERDLSGHVKGLVEYLLGSDKKPVYGPNGYLCIDSPYSFSQWYNNVSGVNSPKTYLITLDNGKSGQGGVYTYDDSTFFPIDNELFGNEGNPHNYHFTYEIHTSFTYKGGEIFMFTGDDDMWVFIDNKLAVDLGGIRPSLSQSVNIGELGLTVGETYNLDLFFAERHTTESHFRIDTSLILVSETCYTKAELDAAYQAGVAACVANPAACGINVNGGDAVILTPDLKMHLPNIEYNTLLGIVSMWADLAYDPTKTDGSYFKVTGAGAN